MHKLSSSGGRLLAGVTALLSLPIVASANLSTSVFATAALLGSQSVACADVGTSAAACSQTFNGFIGGEFHTLSASGSADAAYGSLSVDLRTLVHPARLDGIAASFMTGSATASFSDVLTILGGSGTGFINYFFDGSITSVTELPHNGFTIQQGSFAPTGFTYTGSQTVTDMPFTFQTGFYPITFGTPFTLDVAALANITASPGDGLAFGGVDVNLEQIVVLDQSGQPIPFSIADESGTIYPGAVVPEPSSLLLGVTVVALTGWMLKAKGKPSTRPSKLSHRSSAPATASAHP